MKNLILGFVSSKNSVTFQIPICPVLGVRETLNDENSFILEVNELSIDELKSFFSTLKEKSRNRNRKLYIILIYAVLLVLSAILSVKFPIRAFPIAIAWISVDMINHFEFAKIIILMIESYINPDIKEMKGLHAAIHMVYNAYNELNRVPTIEEAKKFPKYSRDCSCAIGCRSFFTVGLTIVIISLVPTAEGTVANLIFAILYLIAGITSLIISRIIVKK